MKKAVDSLMTMRRVTHVLSKATEVANETEAEKKTEKVFDSLGGASRFGAS